MKRVCLICKSPLDYRAHYCFKCGAIFKEESLDEIYSISYLLEETEKWYEEELIDSSLQQTLSQRYQTKKSTLLDSMGFGAKKVVPAVKSSNLVATTDPKPLSEPVNLVSTLAMVPALPTVTFSGVTEIQPVKANLPGNKTRDGKETPMDRLVSCARQVDNPNSAPLPIAATRPFAEIITDNISTIFALSGALFVGGVVLYYRNEIYHGLQQPAVQAAILALVTLLLLISGWTLVRRTTQSLAGRALTLVGSLLVPTNPWFLVRSHLIVDTGNTWIVALVCTALYAWTAYFLREKIFVYLSLATGILTGWTIVYKFNGGQSQAASYVVSLIVLSLIYLISERLFKPAQEGCEFSRQEYGRPFFHVAQVGIALALLFYSPLISLFPQAFIATKEYFDPLAYNKFITIWIALSSCFAYTYSTLTRSKGYFFYLAIATFLWAEGNLFYAFELSLPTATLIFATTALVMSAMGYFTRLGELFTRPLQITATAISAIICFWGVCELVALIVGLGWAPPGWELSTALIFIGLVFSINLIKSGARPNFYAVWVLTLAIAVFTLPKFHVPNHLIGVFLLALPYYELYLKQKTKNRAGDFLAIDLHITALTIAALFIISGLFRFNALFQHEFVSAFLAIEIAGILSISAFMTEKRDGRIFQFSIAIAFIFFSYGWLLSAFKVDKTLFAILIMVIPYLLLAITLLIQRTLNTGKTFSKATLLRKESLKDVLATLKVGAVASTTLVLMVCPLSSYFTDHPLVQLILMLEITGVFTLASLISSSRRLNLVGFFIAGLCLTLSYAISLNLVHTHLLTTTTKDQLFLVGFSTWSLVIYSVAQINYLKAELKIALSKLATFLVSGLFLVGIIVLVEGNFNISDSITAILLYYFSLICLKEILHAAKTSSPFHTVFAGLAGLTIVETFLKAFKAETPIMLLGTVTLATSYVLLSFYLNQRKVGLEICHSLEILANLLTIASLVTIISTEVYPLHCSLGGFFTIALAVVSYCLSAQYSTDKQAQRLYAHLLASCLLLAGFSLINYLGVTNPLVIAEWLIPITIGYILAQPALAKSIFSEATFNVAQVALPLVAILGVAGSFSLEVLSGSITFLFVEVAIFYALCANYKKNTNFMLPMIVALSVAIWYLLQHLTVASGYYMACYSIFGLLLLWLSSQTKEGTFSWASKAFVPYTDAIFILSATGIFLQTFPELKLLNSALNPLITSLCLMILTGIIASFHNENSEHKNIYRKMTFILGCFTYLVIGIRLGYSLTSATEFYSIPFGLLLLILGGLNTRKKAEPLASIDLWLGSVMLALPLLLHVMEYRFILHQSSTSYDIGLLVVSLALALGGLVFQTNAPAICGGTSFLLGMTIIVFSFVEWEQKWLSVSMIILALSLFGSSWLVYYGHKRSRLAEIHPKNSKLGNWK